MKDEMLKLPVGNFCEMACVTAYSTEKAKKMLATAQKKAAAEEKKGDAKRRRVMNDNDRGLQTKKTQALFNKAIRLRDEGAVCISCQKPPKKKNAGHYLSRGARPELRFEPLNCHLQCESCNSFKSGNQALYRINLIKKIGVEQVEWLEGPHDPKHYTLRDLKILQRWYQRKIKRLEAR